MQQLSGISGKVLASHLERSRRVRRVYGLALALCLGDEAATDRLLEWPGRDLGFDEGYWDRTRADNAYQIWLASRLRGEPAESTADLLEQALGSKRKRPKLLAATAQALLAGDSAGFTRSLTSYLRYYRKSELNPRLVRTAIRSRARPSGTLRVGGDSRWGRSPRTSCS